MPDYYDDSDEWVTDSEEHEEEEVEEAQVPKEKINNIAKVPKLHFCSILK